jgi:hypothetical protein
MASFLVDRKQNLPFATNQLSLTSTSCTQAVNGWPPEVDIGEWKGTTDNWYNTFNTSSEVRSDLVGWSGTDFHSLRADLSVVGDADGTVKIDFYLDDAFQVTQYGRGFEGAPMWLCVFMFLSGMHFALPGLISCVVGSSTCRWKAVRAPQGLIRLWSTKQGMLK